MKKILSTILAIVMIFNMGVCVAFASDASATAEISSVSALPGDKVEILISMESADGIKTLSFLDFTFDSTVLTIVESECAWLADGKLKDIDLENNASIITFEDNTPYSGEILKLVFTVSENAEVGSVPISCKMVATQMIDKIETEISTSITDGEIIVVDSTSTIDDFEYEVNENGIIITGYVGSKTSVVIEKSYEIDGVSYDVVEIAESAFEGNKDIKSVTIPETVTTIGDYAFYDCTSLTEVTILGKETEIGDTALGYYYISRREDGVVEGFTIYGYANSTAESYASTDDEITFVALEEDCVHSGGNANCVDLAVCEKCGETYGSTNENNHKTLVVDEAVSPSCIATGLTEGSHCEDCNRTVVEQKILPASGHDYNSVVTAPTCTAAGYTTYTCSVCSDSYTADDVDALDHDFSEVDVPAVDATCTADGKEAVMGCSRCDATEGGAVIPATGHIAAEAVVENEVAATCTADGSYDTVVYCSVCDAELSRVPTTIPATGHTEGAVVVENEVAASCGTDGSYDNVVYCTVCDVELSRDTVVVPATGEHVYAEVVDEKAATCTDDGYVTKACGCGATDTTVVPATGHTEAEAVVENEVAATCTADGSYDTVVYCSVCDAELSRVPTTVPATGHTEGEVVVENEVAASCGTDGSYDNVVYCTVCDAELSRTPVVVPATGEHVYAEVVDEKAATCTDDGYVTKACGCGATDTTVVPATGHTAAEAVVENEKAADCVNTGSYDTVVYCSVCDAELSRNTTTVDALGHKYASEVTAPTCTAVGYTTYTCSVCSYSYTADDVDALGHDFSEVDVPAVDATCTADGKEAVMGCSRCDATEGGAVIPATGHTAAEAVVENEVAATCTADGSYDTVVYCSVCDEELSREAVVVPAIGEHFYDDGVITEPTYTSEGYTTYTCTVCGDSYNDDFVDALEPEFTLTIRKPSITTIRCKDTIVLHAEINGELPEGATIVWEANNKNFSIEELENGKLEVTSQNKGYTVFTAIVYDAEGNVLGTDTVEMYSKAGFFDKIGGFFRSIFGATIYREF